MLFRETNKKKWKYILPFGGTVGDDGATGGDDGASATRGSCTLGAPEKKLFIEYDMPHLIPSIVLLENPPYCSDTMYWIASRHRRHCTPDRSGVHCAMPARTLLRCRFQWTPLQCRSNSCFEERAVYLTVMLRSRRTASLNIGPVEGKSTVASLMRTRILSFIHLVWEKNLCLQIVHNKMFCMQ